MIPAKIMYKKIIETNVKQGEGMLFLLIALVCVSSHYSYAMRPNLVDMSNKTIPAGAVFRMVDGKIVADTHGVMANNKASTFVDTKGPISNDEVKQLSADVAKQKGNKRITFDQNGNLKIALEQKK